MTSTKKLQVFVSSTYKDLKAERQAAVEAILKAGHIPAGMELFSAGSESQLDTIRRWIDDSDVYMLILGARYGSVESKTSLSYTELEYDYAISTDKPVFAVVITDAAIDEKVRSEGRDVLESERPKELKYFREKVLSKTSSFFSDEKDIKLAVHETLADYSRRFTFLGWVSGKEIVDTAPLIDEIARLRQEKEQLQAELSQAKAASATVVAKSTGKWVDEELKEVSSLLSTIEVSTKVFLADKDASPKTYSVLALFTALRDNLLTGITNQYNASDLDSFLYFNVCPKLELHDLATLEKVAGVQWQRYRLTPKGKALLVFLDKHKKSAKAGSEAESTKQSSAPKL